MMSLYGQWGETNVFGREVLRGEPHCPIKFMFAKILNQDIFAKVSKFLYLNKLKRRCRINVLDFQNFPIDALFDDIGMKDVTFV